MIEDRIERIKAAYDRDQREQPKAVRLGDIPVSYDAVTTEWLTAILCATTPHASVTSFELGAVDDGTSNRRRIYVGYNRAGEEAGLPNSVFCKATHNLTNRILTSVAATFSEVTFYNRIRSLINIDTPVSYYAAYDPESWNSMIVLRDIGDEVDFCSHDTQMDRPSVESQLALLAILHGRFYDSPEFRGSLADVIPFHVRFHNLADRHGLRECCDNGLIEAQDVVPPRLFARKAEVWGATLRSVDLQAASPETYVHSDVHLKNWYFRDRPAIGIGDWQSSGRGHWARDVAYTVSTALTSTDRRIWESELLRFYLDRLHAAGGPKIEFQEAWRHYREQLLSALAWWTVTLTPSSDMPDMQPRETTLTFINRIATAIDDLGSLDAGI
jgi:phosphotransferase family enzyme